MLNIPFALDSLSLKIFIAAEAIPHIIILGSIIITLLTCGFIPLPIMYNMHNSIDIHIKIPPTKNLNITDMSNQTACVVFVKINAITVPNKNSYIIVTALIRYLPAILSPSFAGSIKSKPQSALCSYVNSDVGTIVEIRSIYE